MGSGTGTSPCWTLRRYLAMHSDIGTVLYSLHLWPSLFLGQAPVGAINQACSLSP